MTDTHATDRRRFLRHTAHLAAASTLPLLAKPARANAPGARRLALVHTHTRERIEIVFAIDDRHEPAALTQLNRFLRDHYTGEVGAIDPRIFDQLHRVQQVLGSTAAFDIISGYRCPATNASLREKRGGGVARHSLHMEGRAIDVRLPGAPLADLRDAALSLRAGGVGYYPQSQFVHLDTGRLRNW
jgi:uncharacterized protein YcbK (DUF882 family)